MVQTAVGDEKHMATGDLAVDDAADINAGFTDQIAAELQDDLRVRKARTQPGEDAGEPRKTASPKVKTPPSSANR